MFINQDPDLQNRCPYCSDVLPGSLLDMSSSDKIRDLKLSNPYFRLRYGKYCPFCGRSIKLKIWL